jgi:hypothetical protein
MPKNKVLKVVIIVVLVLLVPFLIGRITTAILQNAYPPPASRRVANNLRSEGQSAIQSLERARAITRIALIVIAVYYVLLIAVWLVLRRRKRQLLRA